MCGEIFKRRYVFLRSPEGMRKGLQRQSITVEWDEHPRNSIYPYTAKERLISRDPVFPYFVSSGRNSPHKFLGGDGIVANLHQYIPGQSLWWITQIHIHHHDYLNLWNRNTGPDGCSQVRLLASLNQANRGTSFPSTDLVRGAILGAIINNDDLKTILR